MAEQVDTSVTSTDQAGAPSQENGSDQGPDGRFVAHNQAARKSGIYARHQPVELRQTAQELTDGMVSDLGGLDAMTTLERAYVANLGDVVTTLRLLVNDLVTRGFFTPGGNPRKSYYAYLAGLDRFDRLAQRVGLKRRARRVGSLAEQMAGLLDEETS